MSLENLKNLSIPKSLQLSIYPVIKNNIKGISNIDLTKKDIEQLSDDVSNHQLGGDIDYFDFDFSSDSDISSYSDINSNDSNINSDSVNSYDSDISNDNSFNKSEVDESDESRSEKSESSLSS